MLAFALVALALPLGLAAPSGSAAATAGTTGPTATAVIFANFSDSASAIDTDAVRATFGGKPGADVMSYFGEASYGKMTVAPSYFGPFTLPVSQAAGCANRPNEQLIDAAAGSVTYSQFSRLVFVYNCPGSDFGSATRVGPVTTPQGSVQAAQIMLDARSATDVWSVVHELAHTLGDFNGHAGSYICLPETLVAPSLFGTDDQCVSAEYGDIFDSLGAPPPGRSPHLDPFHKARAGWLSASQFPTVTQTATFTLAPYERESATQPLALNVPRGSSGTSFTVEYRQPLGFDSWFADPAVCRDCRATRGASIRLVTTGAGAGGGSDTQLLDTTPGTIRSTSYYPIDDARDGALLPGLTFTDPEYGIEITTISADASGLTVRVGVPARSCTRGTPVVSGASPGTQSGPIGSASQYTLTLTNTDGPDCAANTFRFSPASSSAVTVVASPDVLTLAPGASATISLTVQGQPLATTGSYAVGGVFRSNSLGTGDATISGLSYTLTAPADTTAPTAPTGFEARALGSSAVRLSWAAATDENGVVGYRINRGGIIKTVAGTSFVDGQLSAGTAYSYSVQAFDRSGNFSPAATVSATTPAATDNASPTAPTVTAVASDHAIAISWTPSRDNSGVAYYRITPCLVPTCTVPADVRSFVADGLPSQSKIDVQVLAVDGDGNMSSLTGGTSTVYTAAAGTTAPTQPQRLISPSGSYGHVELSWAPSQDDEGVAGYAVYRNNRRIATVTSNSYTDTLAACPSQYHVQAIDTDGSLSPPSERVWFPAPYAPAADSTPPTARIASPGSGDTVSGTVSLTTAVSDDSAVTSVQLYVDGVVLANKGAAPYTFTWETTELGNGTHWLYVRALDAAGNWGTTAVTTVTVANQSGTDETAPKVDIAQPSNGSSVPASVQVAASSTDDVGVAKVAIAVDGKLLGSSTDAAFAANWDAAGSGPGPHTVTATATDAAGNATTALVTVSRPTPTDATPPIVSIGSPANGAAVSGTIQVQAAATDDVAITRAELAVDGTVARMLSAPPWTFSLDASSLGGGSHTLRVTAFDAAGNRGSAEIVVTAKSDTTAPSKPGSPKALAVGTTQAVLSWTASTDDTGVVAYDVYRNGVLTGTTAVPNFLDGDLAAGTAASYQVFARDAAGNRSAGSSSLSVRTPALTTSATGTVAGVVFDAQGKPLANAVVKATIGAAVKSTKTSNSGAWKLTSIAPGAYPLNVTLSGYQQGIATATSVARTTTLTVVALGR